MRGTSAGVACFARRRSVSSTAIVLAPSKKEAAWRLDQRPKSREETPRKGIRREQSPRREGYVALQRPNFKGGVQAATRHHRAAVSGLRATPLSHCDLCCIAAAL